MNVNSVRGASLGRTAAVLGLTAIGLGAFGAHGLKSVLGDSADAVRRLGVWETAARYHLIHAVVLLLMPTLPLRAVWRQRAATLVLAGVILFCGSLYLLGATGMKGLGAVTPLGGVAFLAGWLCLALGWRRDEASP